MFDPTLIQTILFGQDSNDTDHIGPGWSHAGPGFRLLHGSRSDIWLEHPAPASDFVLEVDLQPEREPQRICVAARGTVLGRSVLTGRRVLRYHLPGKLIARAAPVRITIDHEDAVPGSPISEVIERKHVPFRCFALRLYRVDGGIIGGTAERGRGLTLQDVARLTGLPPDEFIRRFESLGQNCEFGALQRQCGAEPLSLLRFGAPPLVNLIDCLQTRFEGFGKLENLELMLNRPDGGEYMVHEKRARMSYHTFRFQGKAEPAGLLEKNVDRLRLLTRKFIEDLEDGHKIFVWKARNGKVLEQEVRSLHSALCAYGKVSLLWVVTADQRHPSGMVEELQPGLLKGYVHRFGSPLRLEDFDLQAWLELCVNAYLHFGHGGFGKGGGFIPAGPMYLPGMAHIQNRGDTRAGLDGWIGARGSSQAIEGMVLDDTPELPEGSLTYQVALADFTLSESASPGQFSGTRGKNLPIRGIVLTLSDALASVAQITCEASFVGGFRLEAVPAGVLCRAESGAPLEALRVTLAPRKHVSY